jgi:hypothetical protein
VESASVEGAQFSSVSVSDVLMCSTIARCASMLVLIQRARSSTTKLYILCTNINI